MKTLLATLFAAFICLTINTTASAQDAGVDAGADAGVMQLAEEDSCSVAWGNQNNGVALAASIACALVLLRRK